MMVLSVRTPLILEIRGNSLDDGPGIRSVVFFKGCPLSCAWCHNPESKRVAAELSFDPKECIACDTCMTICRDKALSRKNKGFIDRKRCTLCFQCADVCPSGALSRVGKNISPEEVAAEVLRDKPFFDTSGGGVTLSGGEPTLFMDYSSQLLAILKKKKVHTLMETCGHFHWEAFAKKISPHLDAVYFDIKIMDPAGHKKHCGITNERIFSNFENILKLAKNNQIAVLPRTPLVPGITDTEENLTAIAEYLSEHDITKAALLPYNPMWHEKSEKIGTKDPLAGKTETSTWMARERIEASKAIFTARGIDVS
jgi:pyruvate formate lyase activating enzyme